MPTENEQNENRKVSKALPKMEMKKDFDSSCRVAYILIIMTAV